MPGRIPDLNTPNPTDKRPKPVGDNDIGKAPKWLSSNAKDIYKKTAKEIKKLGISDRCDENVLALFSAQLDRLQVVSQTEPKDLKLNRLQNDLTASVLSLSKELGITPSARAKLRIAKVEEDDELDRLMDEPE